MSYQTLSLFRSSSFYKQKLSDDDINRFFIYSSETWCSSTDPLPPQKFDEMMPPLKPEICHPHLKLCSSVPENKVIPTTNYSIPTYSKYPCSAGSWLFFFQGDPTSSKAQNLFSMFNFLGGDGSVTKRTQNTRQLARILKTGIATSFAQSSCFYRA